MITQEEVNYIKSELAKGNTKEGISKNLISRGGWTQIDVDEAFKSMEGMGQATTLPIKPKSNILKFFLVFVVLVALGVSGWYLYDTKFSEQAVGEPILQEVASETQDSQTLDIVTEPEPVDQTPTEKAPAIDQESVLPIVGDYEIKILAPVENTQFLLGQKIEIKILAGKFIDKIIQAGFVYEPVKNSVKSETGIFTVSYVIPQDWKVLGKNDILINSSTTQSAFENSGNIIPKLQQSLSVIIDSPRTPVSLYSEDSFKIKVGGRTLTGTNTQIPVFPDVFALFSSSLEDGALITPPIVSYEIQDKSIAVLEKIDYLRSKGVFSIKGLKVGTTKLTVTYKGLSKVIDVIVEN